MNDSTQRVAIVTGAARGIGAGVATRLAADGMAVAVLDLDEAACRTVGDAIADQGGRALAVGCDVSDPVAVQAAVGRVATELGPPLVLVNNAGIIRDNLIFKMGVDDWDAVDGASQGVIEQAARAASASLALTRRIGQTGSAGDADRAWLGEQMLTVSLPL